MTPLTPQVVRAFALLRSPEFAPLMDYLKATRDDALENMALAQQQEVIFRYQGQTKLLKDLIELVDKAPALMNKQR